MKPIETGYKGYKFRSRLEARWAVFFDACGVKWEYEPEGFDLGGGLYYLPDFLLHDVYFRDDDTPRDLWVEVKGKLTKVDVEKVIKFANRHNTFGDNGIEDGWAIDNQILIVTNIPAGNDVGELIDYMRDLAYSDTYEAAPFNYELIDGDWFGAFPVISQKGHLVILDDNGRCGGKNNAEWDFNRDATEEAYRLARQARFEHGQKGGAL